MSDGTDAVAGVTGPVVSVSVRRRPGRRPPGTAGTGWVERKGLVMAATVVFAYDGSEDAQRAIVVAGELLDADRAVIVHVRLLPVPQIVGAGEGGEPYTAFEQAQEREADRVSAQGVEAADRAGFEAEAVVAAADSIAGVWGAVIDVAAEREAVVIVAGRRGVSRVQSALMGSVSNGLVNHAPVPVVVVPRAKT